MTRTYTGKYPHRIRTVTYGAGKTVHLYSNDSQHVALSTAQCRTIAGDSLPALGSDITPYVELIATLQCLANGMHTHNTAAHAMCKTADDTAMPITIACQPPLMGNGFMVKDACNPTLKIDRCIVTILPRNYFE